MLEIALVELGYHPVKMDTIKDQEIRKLTVANPGEREWPRNSAIPTDAVLRIDIMKHPPVRMPAAPLKTTARIQPQIPRYVEQQVVDHLGTDHGYAYDLSRLSSESGREVP